MAKAEEVRGLLYYRAGVSSARGEDKAALGLGHLRGDGLQVVSVGRGPGKGKSGVVVSEGGGVRPGYYPERQTWVQTPSGWLGWYSERKPGPEDLQRVEVIDGKRVRLACGGEVLVPRLRAFPWMWTFEGGVRRTTVHERYRSVYEMAESANAKFRGEGGGLGYDEMLDVVGAVLGLNYAVGVDEVIALGWVGSVEVYAAWKVLTAYDEVEEIMRAQEASASKNG